MNIKIEHANSLPMPTWRWLKLNDTTISYDNIDKLTSPQTSNHQFHGKYFSILHKKI